MARQTIDRTTCLRYSKALDALSGSNSKSCLLVDSSTFSSSLRTTIGSILSCETSTSCMPSKLVCRTLLTSFYACVMGSISHPLSDKMSRPGPKMLRSKRTRMPQLMQIEGQRNRSKLSLTKLRLKRRKRKLKTDLP